MNTMNDVTVDALAEHAFATAKGIIEEGQEANPCFLIQTPETVIPVMAMWHNQIEKDKTYTFIRHMLREQHALAYAFVSEAWSLLDPAAVQRWNGRGSLAQHPDRVEVLQCAAYDRNGVNRLIIAQIKTTDGKRTLGPPLDFPPEMLTVGPAADLFLPLS